MQKKIGLKDIRALKPGEIIWDSAVGGFHARRQKSETISYIVVYRTAEGRQRWQTIGRHGSPWTPDTAREAAKRILGHVVDGADPAAEKYAKRKAASVKDLCDLYIADAEAGRLLTRLKTAKKASTIATDKGRIERHIKPLLGSMKVAAVTREDIDRFMHAVAEGQTAAKTKPGRSAGWRTCAAVRARRAVPWDCSAQSSPMPCVTGCGGTTRCVASPDSRTADASDA